MGMVFLLSPTFRIPAREQKEETNPQAGVDLPAISLHRLWANSDDPDAGLPVHPVLRLWVSNENTGF